MIKFSIIIPVYNAEKTIKKCLDSVLTQTYKNYEVLIMDDGSKDNSYNICLDYQNEDKRFKVYHQENQGPSIARNKCLDLAKGDWICFVDSDDSVKEDYLQSLYETINYNNPEIIFFGCAHFDQQDNLLEEKLPVINSNDKYEMIISLSSMDLFGYTWIKCIKKDKIGDIRFLRELNLFEDEVFICQVLKKCDRITVLSKSIYNYSVAVDGALMQKVHHDYCIKCDYVFKAWKDMLTLRSNTNDILINKSNDLVNRCRYYGLERDVNIKEYFSDLASTDFFKMHTNITKLDKYISNANYLMISFEKLIYNLKIKLSQMLKR